MYRDANHFVNEENRRRGKPSIPSVSDKQIEEARNLVLGLTQQMNARAHDGKWSPGETAVMAFREISKINPGFGKALKIAGVVDGKGNLSGNLLSGLDKDFAKKLTGLDSKGINKLQKEVTQQIFKDLIATAVTGGLPPQFADAMNVALSGLDKAPKISGVDVKGAGKNSANISTSDLNTYYKSFNKSNPKDVALSKMKGKDLLKNESPQVDQQVSMSDLFQEPGDGRDIFDLFNGVSAEEKNPNIGGIYKNEGFSFVNMVTQQRTAARGRSNIQFGRKAGFSLSI